MNRQRKHMWAICTATVLLVASWGCTLAADSPEKIAVQAWEAYQKGVALWQSGKRDEAAQAWENAARLAPGWGPPNARLGVMYQLEGDETKAREQYNHVQMASFAPPDDNTPEEEINHRRLLAVLEAYNIYLVNLERRQNGLMLLIPDPVVAVVARSHSEEMRDNNYFSHESPTAGRVTVKDRFIAVFGFSPALIAENLSRRYGPSTCLVEDKILASHVDLMASPGHRKNLLYPDLEWLGIGLAANRSGDFWLTQVFVKPRHSPAR